jgi:preprotein translocase subunit SecA
MMRRFLRSLFGKETSVRSNIERINSMRLEFSKLSDQDLRGLAQHSPHSNDRLETIATATEIAFRVLGLRMFDVQIQGALALTEGRIAEMQTA